MIDLRSDTVTQPTKDMLEAMFSAKVGDAVFDEDPTINELEAYTAQLFGMQEAIFCPSGTMTNQIALKVHTQPGDEVICDRKSHIYNYEGGGIAFNSMASARLLEGNLGRFTAQDVRKNINPDDVHHPVSRLVEVENTCNKGGGTIWDFNEIEKIAQVCQQYKLQYHLDGARLFNALVETKQNPENYGKLFDSISICLSKGLGAPVGSLLIGNSKFIKQARRVRKVFGGGMRQAGYLAAAGLYALKNNVTRLQKDHYRAQQIAQCLNQQAYVKNVIPPATNILVFSLNENMPAEYFITKLAEKEIQCLVFGPQTIRIVTHLDFTDDMLEKVIQTLSEF